MRSPFPNPRYDNQVSTGIPYAHNDTQIWAESDVLVWQGLWG